MLSRWNRMLYSMTKCHLKLLKPKSYINRRCSRSCLTNKQNITLLQLAVDLPWVGIFSMVMQHKSLIELQLARNKVIFSILFRMLHSMQIISRYQSSSQERIVLSAIVLRTRSSQLPSTNSLQYIKCLLNATTLQLNLDWQIPTTITIPLW